MTYLRTYPRISPMIYLRISPRTYLRTYLKILRLLNFYHHLMAFPVSFYLFHPIFYPLIIELIIFQMTLASQKQVLLVLGQ